LGDPGRTLLGAAMQLIFNGLKPGSPLPLVSSQLKEQDFINGWLQGTGFRADPVSFKFDQLQKALKDHYPALIQLFAAYQGGHSTGYTLSPGASGTFGVFVIIRGITSNGVYFTFDNLVDAQGELQLPISMLYNQYYYQIHPEQVTPTPTLRR
jgi:hypothetical protein